MEFCKSAWALECSVKPETGATPVIPQLSLGTDGPQIPELGLGCMGMSEFYGETDDAQSLAVLDRAYELGVRMFDTADMYGNGHNEALLAQFLK
ncbi:MAG: hypothetical protein CL949_04570, partial [Erythrobacter sp.]|nr:hypothetical protein [Erythrobacter sp.]